jgi:hypothetical protein
MKKIFITKKLFLPTGNLTEIERESLKKSKSESEGTKFSEIKSFINETSGKLILSKQKNTIFCF